MTILRDSRAYSAPAGDHYDCAVRAISIAANIPYEQSYALFIKYGRKPNKATDRSVSRAVHHELGSTPVVLGNRYEPRSYPTLAAFLRMHPHGRFTLHKSGHAFAVVHGVVHDFANCAGARSRIQAAWRIEG